VGDVRVEGGLQVGDLIVFELAVPLLMKVLSEQGTPKHWRDLDDDKLILGHAVHGYDLPAIAARVAAVEHFAVRPARTRPCGPAFEVVERSD
jgi:hypothetical protein